MILIRLPMAHPDIVVEKNLRAYPGVERGSTEWEETYKIRVNVEKSINHFKDSFCVANRTSIHPKSQAFDCLKLKFYKFFCFVNYEAFLSCHKLMTATFHSKNPALQDSILVSQLPNIQILVKKWR
mgnify:FL=1